MLWYPLRIVNISRVYRNVFAIPKYHKNTWGVGGGGKRRGSEREERKKKEDKPTVIRKDVLTLIRWRLLKRVHNSVV